MACPRRRRGGGARQANDHTDGVLLRASTIFVASFVVLLERLQRRVNQIDVLSGFSRFPERPVKPGDTWNSDFTSSNPMLGGITTSIVTTLKALAGTAAEQVAQLGTKRR